jgi:sulfonate transport system ATP-binding protein
VTVITDSTQGPAPTAIDEPAVRLTAVTKRFGKNSAPVLDGIDLTVAPGEFVCLLGASGCGKSTLLTLIAGLESASSGAIELHGAVGTGTTGSGTGGGGNAGGTGGGRAALMFQESALFPWLTAAGNIELALRLRGLGRTERRAEAERLLHLVRLDGAASKRVHELSGGMRQRVALARALAQQSNVLLMDEPFAALDAITRDVLHGELTALWQQTGTTILFVTHNVREAVRLGQRVVLLSSRPGRIAREWTVQIPQPRRIEDAAVAELAREITADLHREISRHG